MEKIASLFSLEMNDEIIKLYILNKKNFLNKTEKILLDDLIVLSNMICMLKTINQIDYLTMITILIDIDHTITLITTQNISNVPKLINEKYIKMVNIKFIQQNIIELLNCCHDSVSLLRKKLNKRGSTLLGKMLSKDYFYCCNGITIYEILSKNINLKYKNDFIKSYDEHVDVYKYTYEDQLDMKWIATVELINVKTLIQDIINVNDYFINV